MLVEDAKRRDRAQKREKRRKKGERAVPANKMTLFSALPLGLSHLAKLFDGSANGNLDGNGFGCGGGGHRSVVRSRWNVRAIRGRTRRSLKTQHKSAKFGSFVVTKHADKWRGGASAMEALLVMVDASNLVALAASHGDEQ